MNAKPIYYLNVLSSTLHLRGCCANSSADILSDGEYFDQENEVLAFAGLSFKWCRACLNWRENALREAIAEKEKV